MKLDELEKLAKSSFSQSTVSIEIHELLELIAVAKCSYRLFHDITGGEVDVGPGFLMDLKKALAELEAGEGRGKG